MQFKFKCGLYVLVPALFVPLSYLTIWGIRAISGLAISVFLTFLIKIYSGNAKIKLQETGPNLYISGIIFLYAILSLAFQPNFQFILSFLVFLFFLYWPLLVKPNFFNEHCFCFVVKTYVLGVIFSAIGVYLQVILFRFFGAEFGKINYYGGGRIGFGFIWSDFSFLSLYLTSAIPLLFTVYTKKFASSLSILLLVASILTTARTGIVSIFAILCIWAVLKILASVCSARLKKNYFFILTSLPFIAVIGAATAITLSTREFNLSGSGRIEGYINAFVFWSNNVFFGCWLDPIFYKLNVGTIPHHLIPYTLAMGGLLFGVLVFTWFCTLLPLIIKSPFHLKASIYTSLFGFNFIPSVYSAYFFSFLLSLTFFYRRIITNKRLLDEVD